MIFSQENLSLVFLSIFTMLSAIYHPIAYHL